MKFNKLMIMILGFLSFAFCMSANSAEEYSGLQKATIIAKNGSIGEKVDDSVITSRVKAVLLAQENLKSLAIHVETVQGIVYLSGWVENKHQRDLAVKKTKEVEGVLLVKNGLSVK